MTCLYIFKIFIQLFCLTMKTGDFERLHYKIITKIYIIALVLIFHSTMSICAFSFGLFKLFFSMIVL